MRTAPAILVLCLSAFAFSSPQASTPAQSSSLQEQLIAADRGIWSAIAGAHPQMEQLEIALASDYLDIDSGTVNSRRDVFDYLKTLTNFSFQYSAAHAYVLSETSGYVIATLDYRSVENGKPTSGRVLTTTVFSKQNGHWKAHLHTEMPSKPAQP